MGDVVLTTHLIRCLRKAYPNAKIDFLTLIQFKEIFSNQPYLNQVITYNKQESTKNNLNFISEKLFNAHKIHKYDFLIDLQNNFRTFKISSKIAHKVLKYRKDRLNKIFMVHTGNRIKYGIQPIPLKYLSTLEQFKVNDDGLGLEVWLKSDNIAKEYLPNHRDNNLSLKNISCLTIAPGARHFSKRYPAGKFINLINSIAPQKLNLIGGIEDIEVCNQIADSLNIYQINNYSGKTSILETTRIIDDSDLVISNDTGVMHIASARRVPQIAFFGSTVPELGFAPFRANSFIAQNDDLACRPCTHIGRRNCPKGHFNCMNELDLNLTVTKLFGMRNS